MVSPSHFLNRAFPALGLGAALFALSVPAQAADDAPDRFEIDGTIGYRFGGSHRVELPDDGSGNLRTGRVTTSGNLAFGGIASLRVQSNGLIYLSYSRQETTFRYSPDQYTLDDREGKGSVEYFQFGGNLESDLGFLVPYFGVSIGMGRFASFETKKAGVRFAAALDAGMKFEILPFLHARLLGRVPFTFTSGNFYCYSGAGCAVVVGSSPYVQGEIQAGLGLEF